MGQEIPAGAFTKQDFEDFSRRLGEETRLLAQWFREGRLSPTHGVGGFELEAWLVDDQGLPAAVNEQFLALLEDELVSPELSQFNVELNGTPRRVTADALGRMHRELDENWARCRAAAGRLGADLVMIGILPTLTEDMLTLRHMSRMERYRALNEQVLRLRGGRPLELDIQGEEHLRTVHGDVMLEAATTSFQLHLQVDEARTCRYYNGMLILSAPLVGIGANSPVLFGRRLWCETRIPVFEQAVAVGGFDGAAGGPIRRVTFGTGYVRSSLLECFTENLEHYPPLLPVHLGEPPKSLAHLRLHNGTIWRWNRPLVGFDAQGHPHLRLEQRVLPAGPSVVDSIANAALFFGLAYALGEQEQPLETRLEFTQARDNFYCAARHGLEAPVTWLEGWRGSLGGLFREQLLPMAREGLRGLGCGGPDIDTYLGVIAARLGNGQTGAVWQRGYLDRHGPDFHGLLAAYREAQASGLPVHEWAL